MPSLRRVVSDWIPLAVAVEVFSPALWPFIVLLVVCLAIGAYFWIKRRERMIRARAQEEARMQSSMSEDALVPGAGAALPSTFFVGVRGRLPESLKRIVVLVEKAYWLRKVKWDGLKRGGSGSYYGGRQGL
ncbi:unnamed protein product [Durusdinium trenchii]|uniref:Uncharacterized protein n=1 Tax=Durusdinium trenchii TaxID=1381693 RepID=A0ABP0IBD3_9DINO